MVRRRLPGRWAAEAAGGFDPVGRVEVAERLGVTPAAVDKWRSRGLGFPEPVMLASGPVWSWVEVERWARGTGRLLVAVPRFPPTGDQS